MAGDRTERPLEESPEPPGPTDNGGDRRRAARYVAPLLAIGLGTLLLLLVWGLNPLWAFAIAPPILFLCGICWVAFRHGFHERAERPGSSR
jgi:fatty acid desaturase